MSAAMKHNLMEDEIRREMNSSDGSWVGDALGLVLEGLEFLLSVLL